MPPPFPRTLQKLFLKSLLMLCKKRYNTSRTRVSLILRFESVVVVVVSSSGAGDVVVGAEVVVQVSPWCSPTPAGG